MVLVVSHAFEVIPRRGLVALVALRDHDPTAARLRLSVALHDHRLVHHLKVHHVVAEWGLARQDSRAGAFAAQFRHRLLHYS